MASGQVISRAGLEVEQADVVSGGRAGPVGVGEVGGARREPAAAAGLDFIN